jgi:hypothetical protein
MGYINLMKMELTAYNIAGAVSVVCFLVLASVVTLDDILDEEEDADSNESFLSWLWGFWLVCLLGIVVVLMRLCDNGYHGFLFRLSMGMLALGFVLTAGDRLAAGRWASLILNALGIWWSVKQGLDQSPVTAWFCNSQMLVLFCLVALIFFVITISKIVLAKDPMSGALDWIEMAILGILTVSCFVVTLAPPVTLVVEDPDPISQEQQNNISSNVEYTRA